MDYRRIPFQFSTTDPLKRQEELQKRFGIPSNKGNMYVDFPNPGAMGARTDANSASNSPRLQHRVPIFVEGQSEQTKPTTDAQNVDSGKKPRVRVIPIEIEGADNTNQRHRWFSGSAEPIKERFNGVTSIPVEKHFVQDPSPRSPKASRVCNIPVKIEGSDQVIRPKPTQKVKTPESLGRAEPRPNGCSASKVTNINVTKVPVETSEKKESPEQVILKKIQNVEEKLKGYHADIEKFSGTNKEKQYRYLDEMLTRCMLELDEIDTMGLETIRLARKAAVKKVQASLDLLETKVTRESKVQDGVSKEQMEVEGTGTEAGSTNLEMTDVLPEQINEKIENISIVEPDEDESVSESIIDVETMNVEGMEPVQITEVEAEAENVTDLEMAPIIEEPLSDSNMDLDSVSEPSSVQISEVVNDVLNPNGPSDQNLEMEVTETSDIPVVMEQTDLSNDSTELTTIEQSRTSVDEYTNDPSISTSS